MQHFARMKINFTCVKVNEQCNKMINVMTSSYTDGGMALNITDLDYVILSAAVGGSGPGSKAAKVVRKGAPLWEPAKLATG